MKESTLIICGTILTIVVNIFMVIFSIQAFKTNLFLSIVAIVFCIAISYFDALVIKYFINKIKERENGRKK